MESPSRPEGWLEEANGPDNLPDYETVFPGDVVNEIAIRISQADWAGMVAKVDLQGGNAELEDQTEQRGVEDPLWVPVEVRFANYVWQFVGFRFKGHSSLHAALSAGNNKLPFKLTFDKFEEDYPEVKNQRFFGFKKISFGNNAFDPTCIRDKTAADLFRAEGVPAPAKAYYAVTIDHGDGPVYFGLYTASEIPGSVFLNNQFDEDKGALYKPVNSDATRWLENSVLNNETAELKSGPGWADYEDAIDKLHGDRADLEKWRKALQSRFNADGFLNWLSVNTIIQNWDSYGKVPHNVFLYSKSGTLQWIAWDFDQSLQVIKNGRTGSKGEAKSLQKAVTGNQKAPPIKGAGTVDKNTPIPVDMVEITEEWPLIRFLMDDPVSFVKYREYILLFAKGNFSVSSFNDRIIRQKAIVEPYVLKEKEGHTFSSSGQFEKSFKILMGHAASRKTEIDAFLEQ